MAAPVMDLEAMRAFFAEVFPQADHMLVDAVGDMTATVRVPYAEQHLRPGGTISGPTMMACADCAMYAAILGQIGPVALTVTTNFTINFLRKPPPADILGDARILKLGKLLATGDVFLHADGQSDPVAHATVTYAIPPK